MLEISPLSIGNLENSFEKTRESKLCKVAADVEFQRKGKIIKNCFKYQISMIEQRHGRGITAVIAARVMMISVNLLNLHD